MHWTLPFERPLATMCVLVEVPQSLKVSDDSHHQRAAASPSIDHGPGIHDRGGNMHSFGMHEMMKTALDVAPCLDMVVIPCLDMGLCFCWLPSSSAYAELNVCTQNKHRLLKVDMQYHDIVESFSLDGGFTLQRWTQTRTHVMLALLCVTTRMSVFEETFVTVKGIFDTEPWRKFLEF